MSDTIRNMPVDFTRFGITRVIVHDIPWHRKSEAGSPVFSEVESPLEADVTRFLEERIKDTLGSQGHEVEFIDDHESPVRDAVTTIFRTPSTFVKVSQTVAQYLFDCQGGRNSAGLLMVADGRFNKKSCVAVVKLERVQGARVEMRDDGQSKVTFAVRHIRDLMLSQNTKVFKAALYVKEGKATTGYASDPQTAGDPLARFFLSTFLGCTLAAEPKVSTKSFFDAAHEFINKQIEDPQEKSDCYLGLMAEMQSAAGRVSPKAFTANYIPRKSRQAFMEHLAQAAAPTTQFIKDTELIRNRIVRIKWRFKEGAAVLATQENLESGTVVVEESEYSGQLKVTVDDEVVDVKGRKN